MIKLYERALIETKSYEWNFSNNPDVVSKMENSNIPVSEKSDQDIKRNVEDLTRYPIVFLNAIVIEKHQ